MFEAKTKNKSQAFWWCYTARITLTSHGVGNPGPLRSVQKMTYDHLAVLIVCKTSQVNQVLITKWQWTTRKWLSHKKPIRVQEKPWKCDVWVVSSYNHHHSFATGKESEIFLKFKIIVLERAYYFSYINTFTYPIKKLFFQHNEHCSS